VRFTDLLSEYNIAYVSYGQHHHVTEGWVGLDCPYCSRDSHRYRLGYNLNSGTLYCWVCGKQNLYHTLLELTQEQPSKIIELLGSLDRVFTQEQHKPTGKLKLPSNLIPLGKAHRNYLIERGLDPDEIVELWGVQGIALAARLSWRLFIPIQKQHKLVSWTSRSIAFAAAERGHPRYISAKASESSVSLRELLYGADFAMHACAVVEGPIDAWSIGYGSIATLGVGYSQEQARLISKYPIRYVVFDSEPKAQQRARKLCNDLSVFPGKTINLVLQTGKDPNEASKKEIQELRSMLI
jgi:hypothetical protein